MSDKRTQKAPVGSYPVPEAMAGRTKWQLPEITSGTFGRTCEHSIYIIKNFCRIYKSKFGAAPLASKNDEKNYENK